MKSITYTATKVTKDIKGKLGEYFVELVHNPKSFTYESATIQVRVYQDKKEVYSYTYAEYNDDDYDTYKYDYKSCMIEAVTSYEYKQIAKEKHERQQQENLHKLKEWDGVICD